MLGDREELKRLIEDPESDYLVPRTFAPASFVPNSLRTLNLSGTWLTVVDEKCQKATAAGVKK